nr:GNAT family N-acetyltransferase [Pseudoalteromonas sp. MMG010]
MNVDVTPRLNFKLMTPNDWPLLWELDQDPAVMKYLTRGKASTQRDIKENALPRLQAFTNDEKGWGLWQVNITSSNTFIGWVLVRPMDFFTDNPNYNDIEIGWRFKQSSWGKGYATEAAIAICDEIKGHANIKTLSATALLENTASINIMKKIGMVFIKHYTHSDEYGDLAAVLYRKKITTNNL